MNISLSPELEALLDERVKSGMYHSAIEVIREALRRFLERDHLKQIGYGVRNAQTSTSAAKTIKTRRRSLKTLPITANQLTTSITVAAKSKTYSTSTFFDQFSILRQIHLQGLRQTNHPSLK